MALSNAMILQAAIFTVFIGISMEQQCLDNCKQDIKGASSPFAGLLDAPLGVVYWTNAGCIHANLTCTGMDLITIDYEQESGDRITEAESNPKKLGLMTVEAQMRCYQYGWNAYKPEQVIKNDVIGCYVLSHAL